MSQLLISISEIQGLSSGARRALIGLISFRNTKTGQCNPKLPKLCERLGVDWEHQRRKVYRWLAELREKGVMTSRRRRFAGPIWYEFPGLPLDARNDTYAGARNDTYAGARNDTYGEPPPLYEQTKGEQGQQRAKRAAAAPQSENLRNAAQDLALIPRKDVGREGIDSGGPIDLYYSAVLNSVRNRGRLLTSAEERQVGNLMMLKELQRMKAAGLVRASRVVA